MYIGLWVVSEVECVKYVVMNFGNVLGYGLFDRFEYGYLSITDT